MNGRAPCWAIFELMKSSSIETSIIFTPAPVAWVDGVGFGRKMSEPWNLYLMVSMDSVKEWIADFWSTKDRKDGPSQTQ